MFTLTCQLLESVLHWEKAYSLDPSHAAVIKSYCMSSLDAHPTRCMKILALLLRRQSADSKSAAEGLDLLKQICRLYVERSSRPLVDGAASILVTAASSSGLVLDFMLENFGYPDIQGRSRVVGLVHRLVEAKRRDDDLPDSHAQKIFLLASHRLANEDIADVRQQLLDLLRALLETKPSLTESVVKWSSSEEPLKRVTASKLAVLCGEAKLLKACLACVNNLLGILDDSGSHDLLSTMLKCNVLEASMVMLSCDRQSTNNLNLSFLGSSAEKLVHLMLSPMSSLRRRLLPVISSCLEKSADPRQASFAPWRHQELSKKILFNLFELLKSCPAAEVGQCLTAYYKSGLVSPLPDADVSDKFFFDRLRGGFNHERREHAKDFSRRKIVLEVLSEIAREKPGWQARKARRFLSQFEETEEIGDQVKALLKIIVEEEEEEDEGNNREDMRSPAPTSRVEKRPTKRRTFSNVRHTTKRQKL